MKRFHFRLQTVHDLREMQRDEAERRLSEAAARVAEAARHLDEAGRLMAEAAETYAQILQAGALDPHETALRSNYLAALAQREREARAHLVALERECEARRQVVVETARAAEATGKLRERLRTRHELEAARDEQKMLDEMASVSSARRLTKII